jgi:hypothetical protein
MARKRSMSRQVATAMSAGLGEVIAIWRVPGEEPATGRTPAEDGAPAEDQAPAAEEAPAAETGRAAEERPADEYHAAADEAAAVEADPEAEDEAPPDEARPDDLRPEAVYVCEGGIALGGAAGDRVIVSSGWADVASFRWSKLIDNSYDPKAGTVSTRISFLVSVEVGGRDARATFEAAPVVTAGKDFFARGADWPDLPDEWSLYRAEGEITAGVLPRFRTQLGAGETVEFGVVALSPDGVRCEGRVLPWESVAGAGFRVGNPDPGAKEPDTGTWLHLSLREPVTHDDGTASTEIVLPALDIDFMDAFISLVNDQVSWLAAQDQRGW